VKLYFIIKIDNPLNDENGEIVYILWIDRYYISIIDKSIIEYIYPILSYISWKEKEKQFLLFLSTIKIKWYYII